MWKNRLSQGADGGRARPSRLTEAAIVSGALFGLHEIDWGRFVLPTYRLLRVRHLSISKFWPFLPQNSRNDPKASKIGNCSILSNGNFLDDLSKARHGGLSDAESDDGSPSWIDPGSCLALCRANSLLLRTKFSKISKNRSLRQWGGPS